jgi:hypothetical protein
MTKEGMKIEGETPKRYRLSYGGRSLGSFDTVPELLEAHRKHKEVIRPVTDRDKRFRYAFADERKEVTLDQLRRGITKKK